MRTLRKTYKDALRAFDKKDSISNARKDSEKLQVLQPQTSNLEEITPSKIIRASLLIPYPLYLIPYTQSPPPNS